ncbi:MAG: biotin transporter BioY [Clostridiales Family XIII bacterium]|nr:biotin transporter BioY [Clostridiales Family XIII bacterium]
MSNTGEKKRFDLRKMTVIALMAAVMCIVGPFSIPLPVTLVPISFTFVIIFLSVYILGLKSGTLSVLIYLLLGLVGLPVFSGFTGGAAKFAGPTGGYLIGYIFLAIICGLFADRFNGNRWLYLVGMIIGVAVCYTFGTAWLAVQANLTFGAALAAGVLPFLIGDALKMALITAVAPQIRKLLLRAGVLQTA